jgi:hypothetical protein
MNEVLRSLGENKIRMLWWGGYVGSHNGRDEYPTSLWKGLLTGNINGNAWFASTNATSLGLLGSDMDFAHYAKNLITPMIKMQNGLAQLLNTTPLAKDGIAVLWSHASDSARFLDPKFINPRGELETFIRFCYQNGLNFDFLTESKLDKLNDYKVLFLLGASAISDKESIAILKFVKDGGVVIADLSPGILNANLRIMKRNQLQELFGNITYNNTKVPALAPLKLNLRFENEQLLLQAAKANTIADFKQFSVKRYGKGIAILLNFTLSSVNITCDKDASFTKFMLDLLAALKIKSQVKISGINKQNATIRVRKANGNTLVGLLADKRDVGKTAVITLPHQVYIYVPGEGYIKHGESISIKLDKPFKLISCFEKRQEAPPIELSTNSAIPGKPVYLGLGKFKAGTVLFIQLRNPIGKMLTLRKKVLIVDKKTKEYPIYFAFNDTPGNYTLLVTDIASGLKSQKQINLSLSSCETGKF